MLSIAKTLSIFTVLQSPQKIASSPKPIPLSKFAFYRFYYLVNEKKTKLWFNFEFYCYLRATKLWFNFEFYCYSRATEPLRCPLLLGFPTLLYSAQN